MSSGIPQNPYLLLTPGPLSTTESVRREMLRDWCTWDDDYNLGVVQKIRAQLVALATPQERYTCALMQGSGTFAVESAIGSAIPPDGKLLAIINGEYGKRIATIAETLKIPTVPLNCGEIAQPTRAQIEKILDEDSAITHLAVVHCETTTGMLNPIEQICAAAKSRGKICIIDAMSSFGGIPLDIAEWGADFLVSSANKCIQGVPGFGFIIASRQAMEKTKGQARSHSMDLYGQWKTMEEQNGKWRFTSPTHTVRAFLRALEELNEEGGVAARYRRYSENHRILVDGMRALGFQTLLPDEMQSPIITAFCSPTDSRYDFRRFYDALKKSGFVIYPGKVSATDTFRIGNIGDVHPADIRRLLSAIEAAKFWEDEK